MRILRIELKNLHSLRGVQVLDFEAAPLADTGLFLITGETGAGKTTLLDAMTLALYGRVHRNTSDIEILTHNEVEAFAAVNFESSGKTYRAEWSVSTARKKIGASLQSAIRRIYAIGTDGALTELASQVKEANRKIEELCGLDYQQFTKSVLLAQGEFASFLKAKAADRGKLLELITSVDIFSKVSAKVFEHYKLLLEQYAQLKARLADSEQLSPDQALAIGDAIVELQLQQTTNAVLLRQFEVELQAYSIFKSDSAQLLALEKESEQLDSIAKTIEQKEPFRLQLLAALKLKPSFNQLEDHKARLSNFKNNALAQETLLVELKTKDIEWTTKVEVADKSFLAAQQFEKDQLPIWEKANALDKKTEDAKVKIATATTQFLPKKQQLEALKATYSTEKSKATTTFQQLQDILNLTADTTFLADMAVSLPLLKEKVERMRNVFREVETQKKLVQQYESDAAAERVILQKEQDKLLQLEETDKVLKTNLLPYRIENIESDNAQMLLSAWTEQQVFLKNELDSHRLAAQLITEYRSLLLGLDQLKEKSENHQTAISFLIKEIEELESAKTYWQRELDFNHQVKELAQLRHNLVEGQPCPLCGAADHPHAHLPLEESAALRINTISSKLQLVNAKIRTAVSSYDWFDNLLEKQKTETPLFADSVPNEWANLQATLKAKEEKLSANPYLRTLGGNVFSTPKGGLEVEQKILAQLELATANTLALQPLKEKIVENKQLQHQTRFIIEEKLRSSAKQLQHIEDSKVLLKTGETNLKDVEIEINTILQPAAFVFSADAKFKQQYNSLLDQVEQWKKNQVLRKTLETQLKELEQAQELRQTQINLLEPLLAEQQKDISLLEIELKNVQQERFELLGKEEVHQLRAKANATTLLAQQNVQAATLALQKNKIEQANGNGQWEMLKSNISETQLLVKAGSESLELEIQKTTLGDVLTFENRLQQLPELETLHQQLQQYNENKTIHATHTKEIKQRVALQSKVLAQALPENQLIENKQSLVLEHQNQLQKIGELTQKLNQHKETQLKLGQIAAQMEQLSKNLITANHLNDLIGAKDGAKFRNFAQGLTLERLVVLANVHLLLLSDRYQLLRPTGADLEIAVSDAYFADRVRDISSLSGGETFIVSLALAMGLSDIAGDKAIVQSLFIDEGFGTLDAQTLDIAIDTLEQLRSQGKTIGIISHVRELRERIATRVVITKNGMTGHSAISIEA